MKNLRLNKHDVLFLNVTRYVDKQNNNTYNIISQAFIVRKSERYYLSDWFGNSFRFKFGSGAFYGYADCYTLCKPIISRLFNIDVAYYSDWKNIIITEEYVNKKEFNRLENIYLEQLS